jgi:hypothetical protein
MKTDEEDVVVDDEVSATSHTSHILVEVVKLDEIMVTCVVGCREHQRFAFRKTNIRFRLAVSIRLHNPSS